MKEAWATALVIQHWLWVALKYFLLGGLVVCVVGAVLGIIVGKVFADKGTREDEGKD